ncbi:MAG: hypothetical protein M3Q22_02895 [Actinomycetota bacterium]|nr:hypothetical protein [Actinomycetota bacterium]
MTDELEMALAWLHGTADHNQWGRRPPPASRSLYNLRCGSPEGDQCLLGGVYATPAGLVFYGRQKGQTLERIDEHGTEVLGDVPVIQAALLTMPEPDFTTPRSNGWVPVSCRHGQPSGEAVMTVDLARRALHAATRTGGVPMGARNTGMLLPF